MSAHRKHEIPYEMIEIECIKSNPYPLNVDKGKTPNRFTAGTVYVATITATGLYQLETDRDSTVVLRKEEFDELFREVEYSA